jgi:Cu+-exporting ATPase
VGLLVLAYLVSGLTWVEPGEVGAVRRWGRFRPPLIGPGLHLRFPAPVETVVKAEPDLVRVVCVGLAGPRAGNAAVAWGSTHGGRRDDAALFFTGDENLVELAGVVEYRWTAAGMPALIFGTAALESTVLATADGVLREVIGRTPLDDILGARRREVERVIEGRLRERLAADGLTVSVDRVRVVDAHPPREVVPAYRDVSAAVSDAARFRNEAEAYAAETRLTARAEAQSRRDTAAARACQLARRAEGERRAFTALASAHAARPALTEFRLLWDTLAAALAGRPKLILDPRASGRRNLWLIDPARLGPLRPVEPTRVPASPEPDD